MKQWIKPAIEHRQLPDLEFGALLERIRFPIFGFIPFTAIIAFGLAMEKLNAMRFLRERNERLDSDRSMYTNASY